MRALRGPASVGFEAARARGRVRVAQILEQDDMLTAGHVIDDFVVALV